MEQSAKVNVRPASDKCSLDLAEYLFSTILKLLPRQII